SVLCYVFFFFFQAEDGIRDFHVTGVQTCALPIFGLLDAYLVPYTASQAIWWAEDAHGRLSAIVFRDEREELVFGRERRTLRRWRSEERRVGKECRSRWARCE